VLGRDKAQSMREKGIVLWCKRDESLPNTDFDLRLYTMPHVTPRDIMVHYLGMGQHRPS
jgi:hypothetical protein